MLHHLPSALSVSRIFFTPPIAAAILDHRYEYAYILCWIAGSTDFFDGFLARRYGWTSRTGAWLDAVSDKVLLTTLYICFGINGDVPRSLMALVLGRDIMILTLAVIGLLFTPIRDFPPSIWGKLSTNVQIAAAAAILAGPDWLKPWALGACAAATAWSGIHYLYSAIVHWRALPRAT
ncbi:MAG: CDP-alcohol phosphatidyltransferase family protein [Acidobacteria bacterium]|nr:CDP-alcohol phosphatidyltransferase family protein [Acidobacteriota bacterium]